MLLQRCYFCHAPLVHQTGNGGVDWDATVCQECWDRIQLLGMSERAALLNDWRRTQSMTAFLDLVADKIRDHGIPEEPPW